MSKIEKSSIVIQKEEELQTLLKRKKKLNTQLKRNKTILEKLKHGIVEMQRNMAKYNPIERLYKINSLSKEIKKLLKRVKRSRRIPKSEKVGIDEIINLFDGVDMMEEVLGMSQEAYEEQKETSFDNTDEFDRQRAIDFFKEFKVETSKEEVKAIRKVFLKLATRFHPDKAKSKREQEQFHQMMQKINEAYERNDLAYLLEMTSKYENVTTLSDIDSDSESAMVDFYEIEIDKFKKEIELLNNQLQRVKGEIKNIRQSELGDVYKREKDAQKYGMGSFEDELVVLDQQIEELEEIREGLEEYLKTGTMPDIIREKFIEPDDDPFPLMEDELSPDDLADMLFGNILENIFEEEQKTQKKKKKRGRRK